MAAKPQQKPSNPNFGSGPCPKRPGYDIAKLRTDALGRSHRSTLGVGRLKEAIELSRDLLEVPDDYHVGIVPASDTGAFEMAMWSLLGPKSVDVLFCETFGKGWYDDIVNELKLENVNKLSADFGQAPPFAATSPENDIVFTWNGTTSGVKVPNADWIASDRTGLTLCDATSAVFAQRIDWPKIDVLTYSWQKALGGEGAHGMLILSPRAVERLESYTPTWPIPKIFRLTNKGKFNPDVFDGKTINTPSLLCVEDAIDTMRWAEQIGGLDGMIERSEANLEVIETFVARMPWISFLAENKTVRSNTSICLLVDAPADDVKKMCALLEGEQVAYDIGSYRDAPAGLRIWGGATVEASDMKILMDWLEWAYLEVSN